MPGAPLAAPSRTWPPTEALMSVTRPRGGLFQQLWCPGCCCCVMAVNPALCAELSSSRCYESSQNGSVWKGPQGSWSSNPPPHTGPPTSTLNTRPAAQGPIQPGLEHLQGWTGHPQPLWAAVPAPPHSHSKELPPHIPPQSALLQLHTISPLSCCPTLSKS